MELKNVLFIGLVWPEVNSSAAGSRMMQLIQYFNVLGASVTFASAAKPGAHPSDLEAVGIQVVQIELNNSSFDDFIKTLDPDAVVFDRFMTEEQYGWRVADQCPECIRILDTEDLHFLRRLRQQCYNKGISLTDELLLDSVWAKRELASIFRSDLSLIISEYEMQLLQQSFAVSPELLCYLPLVINAGAASEVRWEKKKDFVFIGNFIHAPNWDAVLSLKHTIWPYIRQDLPTAKLHIYGAYASDKVYQLHNEKESFLVHGWAADATVVFESARVCLAPLCFGAGLKGKLLEAMHFGTPSVTTSIGAEGINGDMPWGGCIENQWNQFAQASVALYNNKQLWEQSQRQGYTILKERFDHQTHLKVFKNTLQELFEAIGDIRRRNFIGSMLMQQTANASKYMAKWIEAKNNLP